MGCDHSWTRNAACLGMPTQAFYPVKGGSTKAAVAACGRCPVRLPCLDDAMASERIPSETFGIRGGLAAPERNSLRRRQQRAVAS